MDGDKFVADEIIARSELRWDGGCPFSSVEHSSETPGTIVHGAIEQTSLVKLEPSLILTSARAKVACALVEIYGDGSGNVCPLCPEGGDA